MQKSYIKIPSFIFKKCDVKSRGLEELIIVAAGNVDPYFPCFAFVLVAAGLLARPLSGTKSSHRCVGFVRPYKGTVWDPGQCCLCVGAHTARHCSPVLCSTRAAATPKSPAAGIVSHG